MSKNPINNDPRKEARESNGEPGGITGLYEREVTMHCVGQNEQMSSSHFAGGAATRL